MKNAIVSPLLLLMLVLPATPAWSGAAGKQGGGKDADVVVKKNADAAAEVSDSDSEARQSKQSQGGVTYRPAPPGTTHYADGVVVKRNADGSVEVTDQESMHPTIHTVGYSGTSSHRHHATLHGGKKSASHSAQAKTK